MKAIFLAFSICLAACFSAVVPYAMAAPDFPAKPVTLVIPFPPGGGNDIVGRFVALELGKLWRESVIAENRPGAGGNIGSSTVVRAAPDGHTLLFMSSTYTTNAAIQPNMPFDPLKDLALAAVAGLTDMVVTVGNHVPANTVAELVAASKVKKMFMGSTGAGGSVHFASIMFFDAAGIDMTHVPYKGGGQIMVDVLGQRIDVYVGTASAVLPLVKENRLRPLATTGTQRIKTLPNVPTLLELGLKGAEMELWWGVFLQGKTPAALLARINTDVNRTMARPESVEFLAKQDARPSQAGVAECARLVQNEFIKWKALAEKHNIKPE